MINVWVIADSSGRFWDTKTKAEAVEMKEIFEANKNNNDTYRIANLREIHDCPWSLDDDGNWETTCGNYHTFLEGTLLENKYMFCPYCGGRLVEVEEREAK